MALNPGFVGKRYPTTPPYLVGREKVREFATAIGEGGPLHHELTVARAAGHPDLVAPVTFPFVITMRAMAAAMFDPELSLDYSRVVHGEQSFDYVRPLYAGDLVVVDATIEAIDSTGRHEFLTLRAEVRAAVQHGAGEPLKPGEPVKPGEPAQPGELIVVSRSVIVSRGTGAAA